MPNNPILTSDSIQMLIASVTNNGHSQLPAMAAERLLNAIARAQSGVPTGSSSLDEQNGTQGANNSVSGLR